jgi:hypothetical protein
MKVITFLPKINPLIPDVVGLTADPRPQRHFWIMPPESYVTYFALAEGQIGEIKMAVMSPNVLLVSPRFNPNSFWSLQAACDFYGARCPAPPLGLITVAAMLPRDWNVRLINRNAEELTARDLNWADMVMTGGMLPQQQDTLEIIASCRVRGKPTVVGGPDAMSSPEVYRDADFLVLGEVEGLIDQFIAAWRSGARNGVFEGGKFQVDVTKSPVPRFDLINAKH